MRERDLRSFWDQKKVIEDMPRHLLLSNVELPLILRKLKYSLIPIRTTNHPLLSINCNNMQILLYDIVTSIDFDIVKYESWHYTRSNLFEKLQLNHLDAQNRTKKTLKRSLSTASSTHGSFPVFSNPLEGAGEQIYWKRPRHTSKQP